MKKTKSKFILGLLIFAFSVSLSLPISNTSAATNPLYDGSMMNRWGNGAIYNQGYVQNQMANLYGVATTPANRFLSYRGIGQMCDAGQFRNSRTNTCDSVPAYATANRFGTGWTCNWGWKLNRNTGACNPFIIPENSTLNWQGTNWTCDQGYARNWRTNTCDPVMNYQFHR
jgi:hypothetical protein